VAAVIIGIIIAALVVAVIARVAWRNSHRAIAPGGQHGLVPPGPEQQINGPGFTPVSPAGSFHVVSTTKKGTPPLPSWGTNGKKNSFGTEYINPTAICKLTGKQMADCTCVKCTADKKKV
jgi:hypothetical protein